MAVAAPAATAPKSIHVAPPSRLICTVVGWVASQAFHTNCIDVGDVGVAARSVGGQRSGSVATAVVPTDAVCPPTVAVTVIWLMSLAVEAKWMKTRAT